MRYLLFISMLLVPLTGRTNPSVSPALAAQITHVLDQVFADEIKGFDRRNAACFHGEFRTNVVRYFRKLARNNDVHTRLVTLLRGEYTDTEITELARFWTTPAGYKAMKTVVRRAGNTAATPPDHLFFQTSVGQKTLAAIPALKRGAIWQALLLLKDNAYGAYDVFMTKFDWQFNCKQPG